jgi:hypothetical protein
MAAGSAGSAGSVARGGARRAAAGRGGGARGAAPGRRRGHRGLRAIPVGGAAEIERVSEALRRKYARHGSSLARMLRPETLPTTLRLEPA